MTLFAKFYFKC